MHSVDGQTCRQFDCLVVDSGSIFTQVFCKYAGGNTEVVTSNEPRNLSSMFCPTSWVLNRFIETTKGDWITCLCDDDMLLPSYIEAFDKHLRANSVEPQCAYTGQLRVATDASGAIIKVNKIFHARRRRGPWSVDCEVDYLQFTFNRAMWKALCEQYDGRPFPESLATAHHNDGIFMKRATRISKAIPVPGIHCINRRHPSAQYAGTR